MATAKCKHCGGTYAVRSRRIIRGESYGIAELQCLNCGRWNERYYKPRAKRPALAPLLPIETAAYAVGEMPGEKNDCAVRAIAVAACISYERAHALCAALGRDRGKGTPWRIIADACAAAAPGAKRLEWAQVWRPNAAARCAGNFATVAQFARDNPRGHFVLWSRTHAFALVDGVMHDWRATRGKSMQRVTGGVRLV